MKKLLDLHSTIFILKQSSTNFNTAASTVFTFYNIYIKTINNQILKTELFRFTFYNIYIKTGAEKTLAVQ